MKMRRSTSFLSLRPASGTGGSLLLEAEASVVSLFNPVPNFIRIIAVEGAGSLVHCWGHRYGYYGIVKNYFIVMLIQCLDFI